MRGLLPRFVRIYCSLIPRIPHPPKVGPLAVVDILRGRKGNIANLIGRKENLVNPTGRKANLIGRKGNLVNPIGRKANLAGRIMVVDGVRLVVGVIMGAANNFFLSNFFA